MSTLTQAVAIGDTQLHINTAITVTPGSFFVKIDDELLNVGGVEFRDGLTLALKFPATAAHDSGATVTPVLDAYTTDDSSPFASAGGAAQTVSLLGPYRVAWDDTDIIDTGVVLVTLDAGTLIVRAFALGVGGSFGAATGQLAINVGQANGSGQVQVTAYDLAQIGTAGLEPPITAVADKPQMALAGTLGPNNRSIIAAIYPSAGNPEQGEADIYVLTATPSA